MPFRQAPMPVAVLVVLALAAGMAHAGEDAGDGVQPPTPPALKREVREAGKSARETGKEVGQAVREVSREAGHAIRDAAREVGHVSRDAARDIGHATRDAVRELKKDGGGD